jgi:nitrite reductase/ring-hydroxylating ferredoxin subunit
MNGQCLRNASIRSTPLMDNPVPVCNVSDLPPGSMRTFGVAGKKIALANVDGEFFAVDDNCSHEQCSLGTDGALDGNVIVCGCHGGMFDVTTGAVMAPPPPSPVRSYPVSITDGKVFIAV